MWLKSLVSALGLASLACAQKTPDEEGEVRSIGLRTHSLQQPYLDSDMQSRWYDFGGDTIIRTDSYIRLTSDRASQTGWLFSRVPLTATNWEVEVEFKISGKSSLYGDGFAFWVTKGRAAVGPVFGSADNFEGLGVFFDTYKNNRPGVVFPYVMAMVGDGKTSYDKDNDGKATELDGCSARGIRNANIPTKFKLTYFQDKMLKLELQYKTEGEWQLCFETREPPMLPSVSYLGFSSETGELHDNHDIIKVEAKNLYNAPKKNAAGTSKDKKSGRKSTTKNASGQEGSSWTWFLFKIFAFFAVIGGGYVGYTAWRTKNDKRHRF
ncbi:vesicular integral-membrane protein VIP36 [Plectosphaerella cucumerina]|uniref:Vesicular integral-membrane protein VIP36 n=1 Tax=Plectosphaerella cucumerina TaxID=40658 RepID=A0A8K0TAM2_9PEZI|nr:vesicular integral-membrane protein VIP36 [Plectosphaerella cucumerina]